MKRPDPEAVLKQLKGFQRDTVEYAFRRLYLDRDSTRRFLVADEVGLGKTLVARGIIAKAVEHVWKDIDRIDVIYICSNADIARQNINRLTLPGCGGFQLASRITLLPLALRDMKSNKINFISFTPGTSFDLKSSLGVKRERILLYWLTRKAWGDQGAGALNLFQGSVTRRDRYRQRVAEFRRSGPDGRVPWDPDLAADFCGELRARKDLGKRFRELCRLFGHARRKWPREKAIARNKFVGELRSLLAQTCLQALEPDLVILDEFQRFRHLLHGDDEAAALARDLFSYADETTKVRVLLLSATPYKMYTLAHELAEENHYEDFLQTVKFLNFAETKDAELEDLLRRYRGELYALGQGEGEALPEVKAAVEGALRRVMARTERVGTAQAQDGMLREVEVAKTRLEPSDVVTFTQLGRVARELEQPNVVEYWKSAPYLMNFMDHYKFKEALLEQIETDGGSRALRAALAGAPALTLRWEDIERYGAVDPNNARLRGFLREVLSEETWRLLWIPPAAPYYQLEEPFASAARRGLTKRLVFSAWAVVPRVVATLTSYEAERQIFRASEEEPENTAEARERRTSLLDFGFRDGRLTGMPVLGILYPSPSLAALGDTLSVRRQLGLEPHLSDVLAAVEERLRPGVETLTRPAERSGTEDERWYWAAPILLDLKAHRRSTRSWFDREDLAARWSGVDQDSDEAARRWAEHVDRAWELVEGELQLGRPPEDLVNVLARMAVAGPATAALRSFWRISGGTARLTDQKVRDAAARTAWAFRSRFNQPECMAVVRAGRSRRLPYWRRVLDYCAAGCLPALLDEYAHLLRDLQGLFDAKGPELASELADAMAPVVSLRTSNLRLDDIRVQGARITRSDRRLRAHFAMRFGKEKAERESEALRADLVRAAFNSPFWPFVLCTTSVGQEGLDFHAYCHAVVHWNLPANPVDLEQREGRVHRFKGHAIRKNVASRFAIDALEACDADPWERMFSLASENVDGKDRGLAPYWVFPVKDGAFVERHVPALPLSRDRFHLEALKRSLAVYRMVFGQPRQDDLMAYLLEHIDRKTLEERRHLLQISLAPAGAEGSA